MEKEVRLVSHDYREYMEQPWDRLQGNRFSAIPRSQNRDRRGCQYAWVLTLGPLAQVLEYLGL